MQDPRSISAAHRSRLANLLLFGNRLLILAVIGLLLLSVFSDDHNLMIYESILVGFSLVVIIAQWIATARLGCPLCKTPVLAPMGCLKRGNARRLLGSYQLRTDLAIMFTEQLPCPYCNQPKLEN